MNEQELLKISEISLHLDTYDDIFSDFDPRPFSERALSDDFLNEARKASLDKKSGKIQLSFLIHKEARNTIQEGVIKKRLRDHFNHHYKILKDDMKKVRNQGLIFASIGIILMLLATYILFYSEGKNILTALLMVVFEPAGWFLFWEGSNQVLFESKKVSPDLEFYKKMTKCEIIFLDY